MGAYTFITEYYKEDYLKFLGYKAERKHRIFTVIPTHDVDNFARYDQLRKIFRARILIEGNGEGNRP
jgi:hypothetical protein